MQSREKNAGRCTFQAELGSAWPQSFAEGKAAETIQKRELKNVLLSSLGAIFVSFITFVTRAINLLSPPMQGGKTKKRGV